MIWIARKLEDRWRKTRLLLAQGVDFYSKPLFSFRSFLVFSTDFGLISVTFAQFSVHLSNFTLHSEDWHSRNRCPARDAVEIDFSADFGR